jgi:hypothetical protein
MAVIYFKGPYIEYTNLTHSKTLQKCTQIRNLGLKIYHLATLGTTLTQRLRWKKTVSCSLP